MEPTKSKYLPGDRLVPEPCDIVTGRVLPAGDRELMLWTIEDTSPRTYNAAQDVSVLVTNDLGIARYLLRDLSRSCRGVAARIQHGRRAWPD